MAGDVLGVGVHVPDDHEEGVVGKVCGDVRVEALRKIAKNGKIREICFNFIRRKLSSKF